MKTIIAVSRGITDFQVVLDAVILSEFNVTEVVSGTAKGVDQLGEKIAATFRLPVKRFPADWDKYGKSAGMIRNKQMGDYADALIAVWDGKSRGTKQMIEYAKSKGLKVFVYDKV